MSPRRCTASPHVWKKAQSDAKYPAHLNSHQSIGSFDAVNIKPHHQPILSLVQAKASGCNKTTYPAIIHMLSQIQVNSNLHFLLTLFSSSYYLTPPPANAALGRKRE